MIYLKDKIIFATAGFFIGMIAVSLVITGKVQGVGFRYYVYRCAHQLNISGIAKNCSNGDVYIEAEANERELYQFIGLCRIGPPGANIAAVDVGAISPKGYTDFQIIG